MPADTPPKGTPPSDTPPLDPPPKSTPPGEAGPVQQVDEREDQGTYKVKPGDWLSKIAPKYDITWRQLYWYNKDQIQHPDLIHPGQVLRIPPCDFEVPNFKYTPLDQSGGTPRPKDTPTKAQPTPTKGDATPAKGDPPPTKGKGTPTEPPPVDDETDTPPADATKPPAPRPSPEAEQVAPDAPFQDSSSELPPSDWTQTG